MKKVIDLENLLTALQKQHPNRWHRTEQRRHVDYGNHEINKWYPAANDLKILTYNTMYDHCLIHLSQIESDITSVCHYRSQEHSPPYGWITDNWNEHKITVAYNLSVHQNNKTVKKMSGEEIKRLYRIVNAKYKTYHSKIDRK